ncbi:MAG: hypothetical protein HFG18_05885 [Oscillospiraceae bacterium]|nr:hypothetical protein [Oscillospiraceae bacterium]
MYPRAVFFNICGVVVGKAGLRFRRECLVLAQIDHTPVTEWLNIPLWELGQWIEAHNMVIEEREKAAHGK